MLLTQRNVYILPTRPGFMLAATLLVLLVASINYQLNLGYLLTFLLAGSALVGMHLCHGTLARPVAATAAGGARASGRSTTMLSVDLVSTRKRVRHGIGMRMLDGDHWVWTDVPAQGRATVHVAFTPQQRGLHADSGPDRRDPVSAGHLPGLDRLAAGLAGAGLSGTGAAATTAARRRATAGGAPQRSAQRASGEFDGVRAYQRGDPLKLVVWKKLAKADELVSRDTHQAQRHELWLDLAAPACPVCRRGAPLERALSRLCAWVLLADRQGLDFGLRLGAAGDSPGQWRGAQAALPGGAGPVRGAGRMKAMLERLRHLPRDARDTLFLLLVIAWVLAAAVRPPAAVVHRRWPWRYWSGARRWPGTPVPCPRAGGCWACWC